MVEKPPSDWWNRIQAKFTGKVFSQNDKTSKKKISINSSTSDSKICIMLK